MTHHPISRAQRILIGSLAPGRLAPAELQPTEWEALWSSARDHCLVPFLHRHWIDTGFIRCLPGAIADRFAAARCRNAERNRQLMLTLNELRAALQNRGIPILLSKGLPLSQTYYGDLGMRVLYDLDLVIQPQDRKAAYDVVRDLGYVPFLMPHKRDQQSPLLWRPRQYDWDAEKVFDPESPSFVELHTGPLESRWHGFRLECELDLWEGSRLQLTSGVPLRVPSEEKLLVHLAVHYACNVLESNARLMHLLDIILLLRLRGATLDWDKVLDTIRKCRASPFCFVALDLARRAGGCSLPGGVRSVLREATPNRIVEWLDRSGVENAVSMNLPHRHRSLIYFLHWNLAAGWEEKASVLAFSFRSPWREATGKGRLKSVARRMIGRLHYLVPGWRAEGG